MWTYLSCTATGWSVCLAILCCCLLQMVCEDYVRSQDTMVYLFRLDSSGRGSMILECFGCTDLPQLISSLFADEGLPSQNILNHCTSATRIQVESYTSDPLLCTPVSLCYLYSVYGLIEAWPCNSWGDLDTTSLDFNVMSAVSEWQFEFLLQFSIYCVWVW